MATIAIVPAKLSRGLHQWKWETVTNGDVGGPLDDVGGGPVFADKTITITGTPGVGFVLDIEGSNDNVNWVTLRNTNDNADLNFTALTAPELHGILENPRFIRPNISGGDGTTDIDIIILGRAILQLR